MITYKKLFKLLIDRNLKKKNLIEMTGISTATMSRMNSNKYISLEVIEKICSVLDCQPGDLIEYIPEPMGKVKKGIGKTTK